ncbi:poly(ethylene terephthalate) hydrolase family protein [Streptomyces broussonetiae]|uniref:poly(ethylene terephthalate) hydrolase family protein n=1 Tax=Streptomyces broussonetiae TaxID=2686304 RepID=UPI0040646C68
MASVAAPSGPFTTASVSVSARNGFNGGRVYHPTDTDLGTLGSVSTVPGHTARFADEEAWMRPVAAVVRFRRHRRREEQPHRLRR